MILLPIYVLLCTSLTVDYDTVLNGNPTNEISLRPHAVFVYQKNIFSLKKLRELVYMICLLCIFSLSQPYIITHLSVSSAAKYAFFGSINICRYVDGELNRVKFCNRSASKTLKIEIKTWRRREYLEKNRFEQCSWLDHFVIYRAKHQQNKGADIFQSGSNFNERGFQLQS